MNAPRANVGDRVQMRRAPLGPGAVDEDTGTMLGTVVRIIVGTTPTGDIGRVLWDNGHTGRHSRHMLRVVDGG